MNLVKDTFTNENPTVIPNAMWKAYIRDTLSCLVLNSINQSLSISFIFAAHNRTYIIPQSLLTVILIQIYQQYLNSITETPPLLAATSQILTQLCINNSQYTTTSTVGSGGPVLTSLVFMNYLHIRDGILHPAACDVLNI